MVQNYGLTLAQAAEIMKHPDGRKFDYHGDVYEFAETAPGHVLLQSVNCIDRFAGFREDEFIQLLRAGLICPMEEEK